MEEIKVYSTKKNAILWAVCLWILGGLIVFLYLVGVEDSVNMLIRGFIIIAIGFLFLWIPRREKKNDKPYMVITQYGFCCNGGMTPVYVSFSDVKDLEYSNRILSDLLILHMKNGETKCLDLDGKSIESEELYKLLFERFIACKYHTK